jgi:hypothetical protein
MSIFFNTPDHIVFSSFASSPYNTMTVKSLPNGVAEHSSFDKYTEKPLAQRMVLKFGG